MSFPTAIPQSAPLVIPHAGDYIAPAIAAGAPFANHVENAAREVETRKSLRDLNNAISVDELKRSRRRYVAVKTIKAQAEYGVGLEGVMAALVANGAAIAANAEANAANAEAIAANAEAIAAAIGFRMDNNTTVRTTSPSVHAYSFYQAVDF